MANINKIRISGTSYDIQDSNAPKVVELTQAQYDALVDKDPNVFYIITDASQVDLSQYWTSAQTNTAISQATSGKTNQSDFTGHTADTSIHVTTAQTAAWDAKSNFSGDYNDLTNKLSAGTGISIVDNVISATGGGNANVVELTQAQYDALTTIDPDAIYVITDAQGGDLSQYMTSAQTTSAITQAVSGKTDNSDFTGHTADTTVHVTAQDKTNWNAKSDFSGSYNDLTNKLSAGTNVTIVGNVISAEGGGSITIDPSLDTGSTNAVANSAITTVLNTCLTDETYWDMVGTPRKNIPLRLKRYGISGYKDIKIDLGSNLVYGSEGFQTLSVSGVVETSAITTSVTSSSTDAQIPSAKAVYDIVGDIETLLSQI